jgi:hypothetical protein
MVHGVGNWPSATTLVGGRGGGHQRESLLSSAAK